MPDTLRIGIIGLGHISRVHIRSFRTDPRVTITAVAENNRAVLEGSAGMYGDAARRYDDYRRLLTNRDIDAVDILLPHYLHGRVIRDALAAGKHVICEKPFVTDPSEADAIADLSAQTGKSVFLKQYFRSSALHADAMRMILDGEIGTPYLVTGLYTTDARRDLNDPESWRFTQEFGGGGVFMDVGVHLLDYLQELFGNPRSVTAMMQKQFSGHKTKGDDVTNVTYEYPGGLLAAVTCSAGDTSYGFRWEKQFFGRDGSLRIEDFGKTRMRLTLRKDACIVFEREEDDWWEHANRRAITDIVDRLIARNPPAIRLTDAARTIRAVRAAYDSADRGITVRIDSP